MATRPGGGRPLQAAGNSTPHFSENSILTHDGRPYFSMNIFNEKVFDLEIYHILFMIMKKIEMY